jgi:hypothetical protein
MERGLDPLFFTYRNNIVHLLYHLGTVRHIVFIVSLFLEGIRGYTVAIDRVIGVIAPLKLIECRN